MPEIIALFGPKGSGKTTLAKMLDQEHDYIRVPIVDNMKQMLAAFLSSQGVAFDDIERMLNGDLKEIPTEYLSGRTPRHAMQTLGTEWRDTIDRNLWLNAWERQIEGYSRIVVDDMRFQHEAQRVRSLEGTLVYIQRPALASIDVHISEQEYRTIPPDFVITNDREPGDMLRQLIYCLDKGM